MGPILLPVRLMTISNCAGARRWRAEKNPRCSRGCFQMVGLSGFEPPTPCTPCKCASQTALQPEVGGATKECAAPLVKGFFLPRPRAPLRVLTT